MFALVCDDQLFIKPTLAGRAHASALPEVAPYPGAKPCLLVAADRWEEREWLEELVKITVTALPVPTSKKRKASAPRQS